MAVAYDISATIDDFSVTTKTTGTFTIAATADRVAIVGLAFLADPGAITAVTCSGVSGTLISGTSIDNTAGFWLRLYQVIAPPSGAGKTASATWTNACNVSVGVLVFNGANQTTPANGGVTASGASPLSRIVTSISGDMTCSLNANDLAAIDQTTNQTLRLSDFGCMDTGPGSGTTTHTWTKAAAQEVTSGANVVAAPAAYTANRPFAATQRMG
jgi:hypothetical protein